VIHGDGGKAQAHGAARVASRLGAVEAWSSWSSGGGLGAKRLLVTTHTTPTPPFSLNIGRGVNRTCNEDPVPLRHELYFH